MKSTSFILLLFLSISSWAQNANPHSGMVTVNGSIDVPALLSLNIVSNNQQQLVFSSIDDYSYGKVLSNIANLNVKSSCPWVISIMTNESYAHSSSSNEDVPVSIFSLKESNSNNFVVLDNSPQTILVNSNNNIENNYSIDLRVKPEFGSRAGDYSTNVIFTLSKQ